ncbi:unnamed protein product [Linum tenue]|uniref:Cytochrome P450 n=1 Tax=Linum tenue TaxID=586396 RepID=A0AAV0JV38_9ROSI|nr:unnamed protein product [Linum tenue]
MVVSSSSLVKEIVRDQDAIFANRDPPISAVVLTYGGDDVAFSNYGPLWKKLRKVFVREMLGGANLEECYGLRKQQVRSSVKEVHKRCSGGEAMDFGEMAFKTTTNAMLSMLWGGVAGDDEGFYGEFRELESEMLVLMGTPNVSDFIPALARFDLQGIEKKSKRLLDKFDEILSSVIEERLRAVEKRGGNGRKDFLQVLLDLNRHGGSDGESYVTTNQVKALLMDILVGGTDTTSTMLEWTMAQLVKHPDAMSKVYKELNEIVGQNDIVEESHLPNLTYLEAVIKETFRIHPALPLLVPRCPSKTCELGGYTIPKGTIVYLNAYALHTDPQLWEDPLEFKPIWKEGVSWPASGGQHVEIRVGYVIAFVRLEVAGGDGAGVGGQVWDCDQEDEPFGPCSYSQAVEFGAVLEHGEKKRVRWMHKFVLFRVFWCLCVV